jgi:hypothetical protein
MKRVLALLSLVVPVMAQYAGPAILSRGEAPAAMNGAPLQFHPFVEVDGVYSTGLSGIALDSSGNKIPNQSSEGASVAWGISGSHRWKHTSIGLSYRGDFNRYFATNGFDSSDHSLVLGITHQFSRRISVSWDNTVGIINRDYGLLSTLSPAVSFDPSQSYVPNTDFFNNRTIFVSSNANVVIQKSNRLSFSLGGGYVTNIRSSKALYNVAGLTAQGDVQYRLSKRSTLGAQYSFDHFSYSQLIGNAFVHGGAATYAYRLSRWWEFSGYGGFARIESKFLQDVPVDPTVAAIIGISETTEVVYSVRYIPNLGARLSRTFHKGVLFGTVNHGVNPGNGLLLTSTATTVDVGYVYTGLRRWSFGANANDAYERSIGNVLGTYGTLGAGAHISRQIGRNFHAIAAVTSYRYTSPSFALYNQWYYSANFGFGWTPADVPLRIW